LEKNSTGKRLYYLCADTHNYQHIVVSKNNFKLDIIMAGTGGALRLDYIKSPLDSCGKESTKHGYKVEAVEYDDAYGYCEFTVGDHGVSFEYVKVSYKAKYLKYKQKYLQLRSKG